MNLNSANNKTLENVAIIGNGGRENALAWAIQKNDAINTVYLIPGNGGSSSINKCKTIDLDYSDTDTLLNKLSDFLGNSYSI